MIPFSVDPLDRAPGAEPRLDAAAERFEGWLLQRAAGPNFEEAYGSLWGYFGPRGELERRAVIERWMEEPTRRGPLTVFQLSLPQPLPHRPTDPAEVTA